MCIRDRAIEDEDIYLDEFRDEIEGWVIDAIKAIGIDTAKAVLNAPREMLIEMCIRDRCRAVLGCHHAQQRCEVSDL